MSNGSLGSQTLCFRCNSWFETENNCASSNCNACHGEQKLNSCTEAARIIENSQSKDISVVKHKIDKGFAAGKALFSWLFHVR